MASNDFKEALRLDKYNLDQCALEQPELYASWATKWADAVNDRDRAKDKLSVVRAWCDDDIRSKPREFGWSQDKAPTEAFIASAICTHPEFINANELYLDTVHDVNILSVAKEAFEQRRKMIEVLVQLYVSSYYSGNKDMDKGYKAAMDKASVVEQNEGLEKNPRLARRKLGA